MEGLLESELHAEASTSSSSSLSMSSDKEEDIDLLVTAFERGQFSADMDGNLLDVDDEDDEDDDDDDDEDDEDEGEDEESTEPDRPKATTARTLTVVNPDFPVSSGDQHRRREGTRGRGGRHQPADAPATKKGKKGKKGKKDKKRAPDELSKRAKRKQRVDQKRALRLGEEGRGRPAFNIKDISNKMIHFIENEDNDTFEFPALPCQGHKYCQGKFAIKFLSKLARCLGMKMVTLHKMKKFVLVGAMRTRNTPCFVESHHRETIKEIHSEWARILKGPQAPGSGNGGKTAKGGSADDASSGEEEGAEEPERSFGDFEKHTKGFGSRMLEKMGFVQGGGLGKDKQGTSHAIKPQMRKKGLGLGA